MVFVITEICDGCEECIRVCPNDAIILQNNHAFINQDLCQECEICVDSCRQGAILTGVPDPAVSEIIKIPSSASDEIATMPEQFRHTLLQNPILPVIGPALLWTGRELVPRLAGLALGYLDRRIQSSQSTPIQKIERLRDRQISMPTQGKARGRRRQRRRRSQF